MRIGFALALLAGCTSGNQVDFDDTQCRFLERRGVNTAWLCKRQDGRTQEVVTTGAAAPGSGSAGSGGPSSPGNGGPPSGGGGNPDPPEQPKPPEPPDAGGHNPDGSTGKPGNPGGGNKPGSNPGHGGEPPGQSKRQ